jgi:hypothetical protein
MQYPLGVRDVFVGGDAVVRDERVTDRRPGKIVK